MIHCSECLHHSVHGPTRRSFALLLTFEKYQKLWSKQRSFWGLGYGSCLHFLSFYCTLRRGVHVRRDMKCNFQRDSCSGLLYDLSRLFHPFQYPCVYTRHHFSCFSFWLDKERDCVPIMAERRRLTFSSFHDNHLSCSISKTYIHQRLLYISKNYFQTPFKRWSFLHIQADLVWS